jgi:hypothetical protein
MKRVWLCVLVFGCSEGEVGDGPRDSVEDAFVSEDRGVAPDVGRLDDGVTMDAAAQDAAFDAERPRADAATDGAVDAQPDATPTDAGLADGGSACDPAPAGGLAEIRRGEHRAWVEVAQDATCRRTFRLHTTQPLRDGVPQNPRIIQESADQPRLRSGSPLVDALYALAIEEARENAVAAIQDGAFQNGQPLPCPPGGCYETGRLWHYVWTRDTAYATALGLAVLDPQRVRNSLEFKLSEPVGGGPEQIMQDTGTGGSHPISTDRVIWALGARALLPQLEGPARQAFARRAFDAMRATAEHDLAVAFDPEDGLYRGEQSFLDWREQTYPAWVADHLAHIGMSKSFSTNIAHLIMLELLGNLAAELGEQGDWAQHAQALRRTLQERFWVPEDQLFSTFVTTGLDSAPARQYDLLGNALAILEGVSTELQGSAATQVYPLLPGGPPVIHPQQQFTPIYHNRAQWPFVTAFWHLAARRVGHGDLAAETARVLLRGAALNLSHMENFEAVTGLPFVDDGAYSGPVVNSQRQLWSVAGFLALVHTGFFGLEPGLDGLRVAPQISLALWTELFGEVDHIELQGYPFRGRRLTLRVERPGPGGQPRLVDAPVEGQVIALQATEPLRGMLATIPADDYRRLFAPRVPRITRIEDPGQGLRLTLDVAGEANVEIAIYRNGLRIAEGIQELTYQDLNPAHPAPCYTIETRFRGFDPVSQRAAPVCWWGPNAERVLTFPADRLTPQGGQRVNEHGRLHVQVWADSGQGLTLSDVTVPSDGRWLLQAVYSNGAASLTTGVTCGLVRVRVLSGDQEVGRGYLPLPHTGAWGAWRDSGFLPVDLQAGVRYTVVVDGEDHAYNMSNFQHFRRYTGGPGGVDGPFNRANISAIKLLGR